MLQLYENIIQELDTDATIVYNRRFVTWIVWEYNSFLCIKIALHSVVHSSDSTNSTQSTAKIWNLLTFAATHFSSGTQLLMLISNDIANFWHDTRRRSIHIHIFNQESVVRQIIYRQVLNRFRNCSFSFKLLGRITNFRTILVGAQFMFIFMWKTAVLNFNLKSPHWFQGSSLHIVQNWLQIQIYFL